MALTENRQMFINLPVKDLKQTIEFFTNLGFTFNPQFTDENATCMIVGKDNFVMLLVEKFFKGFIPHHEINDALQTKETLIAISLESRIAVDKMIEKAIANGGKEYRPTEDHGWMYGRSFQDINGHVWEPFYMNKDAIPEER
ncbi:VOC family protein [Legionella cardiaca]|uniref:VOC domain-containing protein n=1 Tax=Legionella cardiaca TaxID=1071983 RepID=A0ABY8ASW4_9GAMM|nr:VOC family protein [Legionella cardiaca]WED43775.1 hypothetical protein PXX05_03065 [Legionella cardiaca]